MMVKKKNQAGSHPRINKKDKVGVLYGGFSAEREVSIRSGEAVIGALREKGYRPAGIDVGKDLVQRLEREKIQAAFLALHGRLGEDGSVQGLLEMMRIPYTGSGVLASAMGMDKFISRLIFRASGLKVPKFIRIDRNTSRLSLGGLERNLGGCPVMVKPRAEGSSVGVSQARNSQELKVMIKQALSYGEDVLVEGFLSGPEVHVGILNGKAMGEVEVVPREGFYDYRAKYTPGSTEYILPARIKEKERRQAYEAAETAHAVLGCEGVTRVDLIFSRGQPYVLEINTIPGLTETSLIPKIAARAGMDYSGLVEMILQGAGLKIPVRVPEEGSPAGPESSGREG